MNERLKRMEAEFFLGLITIQMLISACGAPAKATEQPAGPVSLATAGVRAMTAIAHTSASETPLPPTAAGIPVTGGELQATETLAVARGEATSTPNWLLMEFDISPKATGNDFKDLDLGVNGIPIGTAIRLKKRDGTQVDGVVGAPFLDVKKGEVGLGEIDVFINGQWIKCINPSNDLIRYLCGR